MSNSATLRILAVSSDVLFNPMDDVFVTGICRAVAGIACTSVPGVALRDKTVTDCDIVSGIVMNFHRVNSTQQMMRLWNLVNNNTAAVSEQECAAKTLTLHIVVALLLLLFIICCFSTCQHRLLILQRLFVLQRQLKQCFSV